MDTTHLLQTISDLGDLDPAEAPAVVDELTARLAAELEAPSTPAPGADPTEGRGQTAETTET